jgi:Fuc2NAc and GlcNAc transferase
MTIPLTAAVTFLVVALLTAAWQVISRRYALLDVPNARSSHAAPIATGAGVVIIAAFVPLAMLQYAVQGIPAELAAPLAAGGLLLGAVGIIDDFRDVSPRWRLLAQAIAAVGAIAMLGPPPELAQLSPSPLWQWILLAVVAVGVVWHVNLFNFMDGIDGIAAAQAVFVTTAAALLSWLAGHPELNALLLYLTAACAGFLVWNWPPAKIFMGNAGSGFLGFTLAVLALYSMARMMLPIWTWLILMATFLVDATATVVRRLLRGEDVLRAHRSHAYQWWAQHLGSHAKVTVAFALINVFWLLPLALAATFYSRQAPLITLAAIAPLVAIAWVPDAGRTGQAALERGKRG